VVSGLVQHLLSTPAVIVYVVVGLLVFAEDALFVGFVLPGETAAILGGVDASRHRVNLWIVLVVVVAAEIVGDSVGYQIGRRFGPRVIDMPILRRHRTRIDDARELLARRGGWAVFVGRSVAFFRAVMPALAGVAHMPYRRFLAYNAAGGLVWGVGAVMVGFLAGHSYQHVASALGQWAAIALGVLLVAAVIAWRVRKHKHDHAISGQVTPHSGRREDAPVGVSSGAPAARPAAEPEPRRR
jgi:membrane protein DedA with SNARE-associated domain